MLQYLPWSTSTHNNCLSKYRLGKFSCLDIELGGKCNYHCVYCDSPDRQKGCIISLNAIETILSQGSFDWIFVCGLGEPTYSDNYEKFIDLLNLCKKYHVRCSAFSNLSNLTNELSDYIADGILHLLFKYDSYDSNIVQSLYGTKYSRKQLDNIKLAKQLVLIDNNTTNLAASIVPTRLNKNYIVSIVEECLSSNIFPLIGELELSGKGQINYANLCLDRNELLQLKDEVEKLIGETYTIPICPSVISGIHFSSDSFITVDEFTGLSCHWFWLEEPKVRKLIHFNEKVPLKTIEQEIITYRNSQIEKIQTFLSNPSQVGLAFGGCGGEVQKIFEQYIDCHRRP